MRRRGRGFVSDAQRKKFFATLNQALKGVQEDIKSEQWAFVKLMEAPGARERRLADAHYKEYRKLQAVEHRIRNMIRAKKVVKLPKTFAKLVKRYGEW